MKPLRSNSRYTRAPRLEAGLLALPPSEQLLRRLESLQARLKRLERDHVLMIKAGWLERK